MTLQPAPAPLMGWQAALAIGLAAGVLLGLALFYAIDRVRVLTGHTYRDLRHAGWRADRDPEADFHRHHVCTEQSCDRLEDA